MSLANLTKILVKQSAAKILVTNGLNKILVNLTQILDKQSFDQDLGQVKFRPTSWPNCPNSWSIEPRSWSENCFDQYLVDFTKILVRTRIPWPNTFSDKDLGVQVFLGNFWLFGIFWFYVRGCCKNCKSHKDETNAEAAFGLFLGIFWFCHHGSCRPCNRKRTLSRMTQSRPLPKGSEGFKWFKALWDSGL